MKRIDDTDGLEERILGFLYHGNVPPPPRAVCARGRGASRAARAPARAPPHPALARALLATAPRCVDCGGPRVMRRRGRVVVLVRGERCPRCNGRDAHATPTPKKERA